MKAEDLKKLHKLMQKAHKDEFFKAQLLKNPKETLEKGGIKITGNKKIKVFENTKSLFYLTIPRKALPKEHLLKNLPKNPTLGQVTAWITTQIQQNAPLKDNLLKNTTEELSKHGVKMPKGVKVKLLLNTDSEMYFVIPRKISENEELNDMELQAVSGGKGDSSVSERPTETSTESYNVPIQGSFNTSTSTTNTDSGNASYGGNNSLFMMGGNYGTIDMG